MKEVEAAIVVYDCPLHGENVTMENCALCKYHTYNSFRHGQIYSPDGYVKCAFDEKEVEDE